MKRVNLLNIKFDNLRRMKRVNFLNIKIDNLRLADALEQILEGFIVTPNADHLVKVQRDKEFYQIYQNADYVLCDSKIVQVASSFLGTPITEKISGSDFFPAFYKHHRRNNDIKIFLLGAKPGVAKTAARLINKRVGRDIIIDAFSPKFGFEYDEMQCDDIVTRVNRSGATVLATGLGAPKGEKWISNFRHQMPFVKIFMSIGATIDFEAGNIKRAPKWMSGAGIEWLYRLVQEPRRLSRRYLVDDLPFCWLVIKKMLGLYRDPFRKDCQASDSRTLVN